MAASSLALGLQNSSQEERLSLDSAADARVRASLEILNGRGTTSSGGGDENGLVFIPFLEAALGKLNDFDSAVFTQYHGRLKQVEEKAKVVIVDVAANPSLDQIFREKIQNSVALNIIETQVVFLNSRRWNRIRIPAVKEAIALHEALSLLNVESTGHYPISGRYLVWRGVPIEVLIELYGPSERDKIVAELIPAVPILVEKFEQSLQLMAQAPGLRGSAAISRKALDNFKETIWCNRNHTVLCPNLKFPYEQILFASVPVSMVCEQWSSFGKHFEPAKRELFCSTKHSVELFWKALDRIHYASDPETNDF
jgi:hypothetical protein